MSTLDDFFGLKKEEEKPVNWFICEGDSYYPEFNKRTMVDDALLKRMDELERHTREHCDICELRYDTHMEELREYDGMNQILIGQLAEQGTRIQMLETKLRLMGENFHRLCELEKRLYEIENKLWKDTDSYVPVEKLKESRKERMTDGRS